VPPQCLSPASHLLPTGPAGAPAPNDVVCFPNKVTLQASRSGGSAWECEATMDVKGRIRSVACKLVAG